MKISEALAAYRVLARAEGRSPRTIGWITSSVGYFSQRVTPFKVLLISCWKMTKNYLA